MPEILLAWLAVVGGLIVLVWSADRFVDGSAAFANNFGVPKLIIGLTIVSLGTSAPEILVAINAALSGVGSLAIGNALGSNLANIGMVLGITALIAPLPAQGHLLRKELPILLLVTFAAGFVLWDLTVSLIEGISLLVLLFPLMYFMATYHQHELSPAEIEGEEEIPEMSSGRALFWFLLGLGLLIASSNLLVWGAQLIAIDFGISPLVIGLTLIAVGTSLPELAATVMSALRQQHDIAIGNIIGSNIFNIMAVIGAPALITELNIEAPALSRDYVAMLGMTLVFALVIWVSYQVRNKTNARLGRATGLLFLALYGGYYYWLSLSL